MSLRSLESITISVYSMNSTLKVLLGLFGQYILSPLFVSRSFSFCLQVCIISIFYFARKRGKVLGLHLNDLLMSYNLLFNFGLNTCRETNIILLKFKICLISSFQK